MEYGCRFKGGARDEVFALFDTIGSIGPLENAKRITLENGSFETSAKQSTFTVEMFCEMHDGSDVRAQYVGITNRKVFKDSSVVDRKIIVKQTRASIKEEWQIL